MNIIETDGDRLLSALRTVLGQKHIVSPAEIAERIAITDRASPKLGARMVAKAWTDPAFRTLLVEDGTRAAESLGIVMRGAKRAVGQGTQDLIVRSFGIEAEPRSPRVFGDLQRKRTRAVDDAAQAAVHRQHQLVLLARIKALG